MKTNLAPLDPPSRLYALRGFSDKMARFLARAESIGNAQLFRAPCPGPDAILLNSLDQLCLAGHPSVRERMIASLRECEGYALRSSFYLDAGSPHRRFERRIAEFLGLEAAMLCQSGWDANVNLIQSIADADTPVYIDRFAHASAYEGIHAASARPHVFRHNNLASLARRIRTHGPGVVVVDAVYSVPGSVCPLADVVRLCREMECVLVVDESHSMGLYGRGGRGLLAELGLTTQIDFVTFSLSKTFVSRGGMIAGGAAPIEFCRYESRQAVFSGAIATPHDIAGMEATLDLIEGADDRRARLHANAAYLRPRIGAFFSMEPSATHIIPLRAGSDPQVLKMVNALESRELYGSPFIPPATPLDGGCVRLTVHSELTRAECDRTVAICAEIRDVMRQPD
jgi:CAI-1 autoinducer synthase